MKRRDIFFSILGLGDRWQVVAMLVNRDILPAPWDVFVVFIDELDNGLVTHFLYSLWRVTAGMLLSVLAAAPAGLLIGGWKRLDRIFSPSSTCCIQFPKWSSCLLSCFFWELETLPRLRSSS